MKEGFIANIFAVERMHERENFQTWKEKTENGSNMLLWHGTKAENVVGILQTGFRIAPSDAQHTGAMFGEGVYFADIFNKAYQYSQSNNFNHFGSKQAKKPAKRYIFLCEVALGTMKVLYQAEQVKKLPNKTHQSVMGFGKVGPNKEENIFLPNGCVVPIGKIIENEQPKLPPNVWWSLQHNEYVVYDTTQIKVRYLLELRDQS
jgi:hypothetical protein